MNFRVWITLSLLATFGGTASAIMERTYPWDTKLRSFYDQEMAEELGEVSLAPEPGADRDSCPHLSGLARSTGREIRLSRPTFPSTDQGGQASTGLYMEFIGDTTVADLYYKKVGAELREQLDARFE